MPDVACSGGLCHLDQSPKALGEEVPPASRGLTFDQGTDLGVLAEKVTGEDEHAPAPHELPAIGDAELPSTRERSLEGLARRAPVARDSHPEGTNDVHLDPCPLH